MGIFAPIMNKTEKWLNCSPVVLLLKLDTDAEEEIVMSRRILANAAANLRNTPMAVGAEQRDTIQGLSTNERK